MPLLPGKVRGGASPAAAISSFAPQSRRDRRLGAPVRSLEARFLAKIEGSKAANTTIDAQSAAYRFMLAKPYALSPGIAYHRAS